MDKMVLAAQKWLNENYKGKAGYSTIDEDGRTGNIVMESLVTALQIDLGISNPTGYFGDSTAAAYNQHLISGGSDDSGTNRHLVKILQYGLYCKGYNPTGVTGTLGKGTLAAVKNVQKDAGFSDDQIGDTVTAKVFKEILCSDALILINGGNSTIRSIQQNLNRKYSNYFGIISCDGMYEAQLAKALIYAFQAEGGMDTNTANGHFGSGTQSIASSHPQNTSSYEENFVLLAKYALYCNGVRRYPENKFDTSSNGSFTGVYDEKTAQKVRDFQEFAGIMEVTGEISIKEWMSLLVSTGYPKRNVLACDSSTQITETKAKRLVANDFKLIGRYLTGSTTVAPKNLTRDELNILFSHGLSVFAIYQDEKEYYNTHPDEETTVNYYNYDQGVHDAEKAVAAAETLGIAYGEYIFFSVDYDFTDKQVTTMIIPHFKGIHDYISANGSKYHIGVYGPRNICTRVNNLSYADLCFVSDMSTGYSGNIGFTLPEFWAFDQIREYTQGAADGGFNVDCVAASGLYDGFSSVNEINIEQPHTSSATLEMDFYRHVLNSAGILGLQENLELSHEYNIPVGNLTVSFLCTVGIEKDFNDNTPVNVIPINIKNGEYEGSTMEISQEIYKNLSNNVKFGVSSEGAISFNDEIKWEIKDGYIATGFEINTNGQMVYEYVFHKDSTEKNGLDDYVEVKIKIINNTPLSDEEISSYNKSRASVKKEGIALAPAANWDAIINQVIVNLDFGQMAYNFLVDLLAVLGVLLLVLVLVLA